MIIGPKYKICRRLGSTVFEKCQTKSFADAAAAGSGRNDKKKRPGSDFNKQLLEKQKLRLLYSLTERQFASYVKDALESASPSQHLFASLESRLDSVAYRMGLVTTRRAARQLAAHGHLTVNGKRITIPSYRVSAGDTVAIRDGSKGSSLFGGMEERLAEYTPSPWVVFDADKKEGTMKSAPAWGAQDSIVDFGAVFEYYTR